MFFETLEKQPQDGEKVKIRFRSGQQFEADRVIQEVAKIEGVDLKTLCSDQWSLVWSAAANALFEKSTAVFEIVGRVK
jgi:hypothetical protein